LNRDNSGTSSSARFQEMVLFLAAFDPSKRFQLLNRNGSVEIDGTSQCFRVLLFELLHTSV
jgi:hypothetical protein